MKTNICDPESSLFRSLCCCFNTVVYFRDPNKTALILWQFWNISAFECPTWSDDHHSRRFQRKQRVLYALTSTCWKPSRLGQTDCPCGPNIVDVEACRETVGEETREAQTKVRNNVDLTGFGEHFSAHAERESIYVFWEVTEEVSIE